MIAPPDYFVQLAIELAKMSPCQKSKRGAAIFDPTSTQYSHYTEWSGFNGIPRVLGRQCDGSPTCRRDCGKICSHAEQRAVRAALAHLFRARAIQCGLSGYELVHIKVVDGVGVPGGQPSCWQCARDMADVGLDAVWLYQDMWTPTKPDSGPQWRRWPMVEFLAATLQNEKLHPFVEHKLRLGAIYECSCGYQPSSEDDLVNHIAAEDV